MVVAQEIKPCPFCGNVAKMRITGDKLSMWVECKHCGAEGGMGKTREEAIEIWNRPSRLEVKPRPCVRDENGEIQGQRIRQLFAKIDEEINELKAEVFNYSGGIDAAAWPVSDKIARQYIALEGADAKTAITTLEQALGIDTIQRDEAQVTVNRRNEERGRL